MTSPLNHLMAISAISITIYQAAHADLPSVSPPITTTDPAAEYFARSKDNLRKDSDKGEHMVKLEIDIDNDGLKDTFLSCERSSLYDDDEYQNGVRIWRLYRKLPNSTYALIDQKLTKPAGAEPTVMSGQSIEFSPAYTYVGPIKEVKGYGMLAMYFLPKHNEAILSVFVLRGNYFEEMDFPDPQNPSGIYHRSDDNTVPDMPANAAAYFKKPIKEKITLLQSFP